MDIRMGNIEDFTSLNEDWAWSQADWQREAQKKTIQAIEDGNQEFWVIENNDQIIGEIHICWRKDDEDAANGHNRAYLFALRLHPDFRGQGLGTKLIQRVLQRVRDNGFTEVTIGAYKDEPHLKSLYNKWGFTSFVKEITETTSEYSKIYELFLKNL